MTAASNSEATSPECPEPCCVACGGSGAGWGDPCSDCYATGHTHPQEAQASLSQPIPAPVDSGAIGRLTDDERAWILCAYRDGVLAPGQAVLIEVERIVREHTDRALAEVESVVRHWERTPALRRGTAAAEIRRALHRARAARKEQGR